MAQHGAYNTSIEVKQAASAVAVETGVSAAVWWQVYNAVTRRR